MPAPRFRPPSTRARRRLRSWMVFWAIVATLSALWVLSTTPSRPPIQPLRGVPGHVAATVLGSRARPSATAPVRIRVPAAGVDAPVGAVALDRSGALPAPTAYDAAAWWSGSPTPGATGPSVIVGHLDTATGPAVFAGLSLLHPGDSVSVQRADGSTAVFTVRKVALYTKAHFPTATVYGPSPDPELRLITCGGAFDRRRQQYLGNVVVFAVLSRLITS